MNYPTSRAHLSGQHIDLSATEARASLPILNAIDVRSEDEYHGPLGHIAGSLLIPLGTLEGATGALDPTEPVLVICRSGVRSTRAAELLVRSGFRSVYNLDGGMIGWNETGHETCAHSSKRGTCVDGCLGEANGAEGADRAVGEGDGSC